MKNKIIYLLIFLLATYPSFSQPSYKYSDIDALIKTESMIDAMTALNKLKDDYKKDTVDSEYWLRYSKACYIFFKDEEAVSAINKAISFKPNHPAYHFEKGLLLNKTGKKEEALKSLKTAVQLKDEGEYYYWKGIVNQQLNNISEAAADYQTALGKNFETPELYNNLAIILITEERLSEGLHYINRAILLNTNYAQAYSARSKIHLCLFNIDSACMDIKMAYKLGYKKILDIPDSVCSGSFTIQMKYAADFCAAGNLFTQGIKAYSALIDKNILHSDYFLNRGYCYYKIKDYVHAENDYLKALEFPDAVKDIIYDNLSLLYFDQENYTKSKEYSTKRIELNPMNHVPYIDRGLCYRKLKKYKEAEKDFNKSLEIKPDFFRAFGYRAFLYLELGQYNKSLEDASKAVKLNPKYGYGYIILAQAKQRLGLPDYCIDFYNAKKYGDPDAEAGIKEFCK